MSLSISTISIRSCTSTFNEFAVQDIGLLPFQWIKFAGCIPDGWHKVAQILLCASKVEILVIDLREKFPIDDFFDKYLELDGLDRLIKEKGVKLELIINSIVHERDRDALWISPDLTGSLVKLELIDGNLLQMMMENESFDLLTEIRLETCIDLSDATLESVAKWCKNLKKLICQPRDQNALTDQCLIPFMNYWNDREPSQLSIECLKPAQPFGGFNLAIDQEKGDFSDGKKWMLFRKACQLDGCDQFGTRLVIWEPDGEKSMVITEYKRKFDKNVKISMIEGKCIVEEKRGNI